MFRNQKKKLVFCLKGNNYNTFRDLFNYKTYINFI